MKILGIDYGDKKIGLAISDKEGKLASRFLTIKNFSTEKTLQEIKNVVAELGIQRIVVGLPVGLKSRSEQTIKTEEFIKSLEGKIDMPIEKINEVFSSKMAESNLHSAGFKGNKVKELVDQEAARIILQDYLDNNQTF